MAALGTILPDSWKDLVDLVGIEPTTSSMPWKRAPSCATGPLVRGHVGVRCERLIYSRRRSEDSQRVKPKPQSTQRTRRFKRKTYVPLRPLRTPRFLFLSAISSVYSTGLFCHN